MWVRETKSRSFLDAGETGCGAREQLSEEVVGHWRADGMDGWMSAVASGEGGDVREDLS